MFNKKGNFAEDATRIILAVLALGIFFGVLVLIYNAVINKDSRNASNVLEIVVGKVKNFDIGDGKFLIRGVDKWFLVGWSKEEAGRPDKCFFNSCLCICKSGGGDSKENMFKDTCQEKGFCEKFDEDEFFVYGQVYVSDISGAGRLKGIQLENKLMEIFIRKEKNKIQFFIEGKEVMGGTNLV